MYKVLGVLVGMLAMCAMADAEPVRVLILSGQNNHAWQETTPVLKRILEESGRFAVEVTDAPQGITAESLKDFDVILSNWNGWDDAAVKEWPEAARSALMEFVKGGKGFVSVHAGTSSFYDWPEYQELAMASWKIGETGHGKRHAFPVKLTPEDHPITRGMLPFETFDELWHGVPIQPDARVLATAYSSKDSNGSGNDEPMVMVREFGKGRGVNILLGHDVQAMETPSFGVLLSRGVEWAATNEVTLPARKMEWAQADGSLGLKANGQVVWQLNYGNRMTKPHFHPLSPVGGPVLSWVAPPDHVWHYGLWFSWKFINGANYWEEDKLTGLPEGATVWDAPGIATEADGSAKMTFRLRYEAKPGEVLLTEERTLDISAPDRDGAYRIDWRSEFTAQAPEVLLDRTPIEGEPDGKAWGGYAGLSMRFAPMTAPQTHNERENVWLTQQRSHVNGESIDYSGLFDGREAGVAMFQLADNPLHPVPWYLISNPESNFYFFSPTLLYPAPMKLKQGEKLTLSYRIQVHNGRWTTEKLAEELKNIAK